MQGQSSIPVSVYIITLNEADKLYDLLTQLKIFAEVIIVDCGSTDATPDIAKKFANVRFSHHDWAGYAAQKSHALSLCSQDWVLNLDADEKLSSHYILELQATIQSPHFVALQSRRVLYRWGKRPNSFMRDDRLVRLFKKEFGRYDACRVHERISVDGPVKQTDAAIVHQENLTFGERIKKSNNYSELKALDKFDKGNHCNLLVLLAIFPWSFIQSYLFKGCFMDGTAGFLTSMNIAYYNFMKYAKLWEIEKLVAMEAKELGQESKQAHNYLQ